MAEGALSVDARIRQILRVLANKRKLSQELYDKGGEHPKDIAIVQFCDDIEQLVRAFFPEVDA